MGMISVPGSFEWVIMIPAVDDKLMRAGYTCIYLWLLFRIGGPLDIHVIGQFERMGMIPVVGSFWVSNDDGLSIGTLTLEGGGGVVLQPTDSMLAQILVYLQLS
jgi:hypothetical protein